ncbi:hypothetical protein [Nocardioides zeae]
MDDPRSDHPASNPDSAVEALVYEEVACLRAPYVVLCTSRRHGPLTTSGPYPDALAALVAADHDRAHDAQNGVGDADLRFDVMRLFPPRRV